MLLVPNAVPLTVGLVSAPVTAISTSPPCTRAEKPPNVISIVARSSGLATSRLAKACARRSAAPDRVTPRWASPILPRSSISASGPVVRTSSVVTGDLLQSSLCGPELHPHTGCEQRRLRPVDVPQHGIGVPDQLPAARRPAGIDAAEFTGQRDRSGGHRGARLRPAGYDEAWVAADQVAEPRSESTERHP